MSDLITNNPAKTSASTGAKPIVPSKAQSSPQASEAPAQETQSMQSGYATVYNPERDPNSNSGYRGPSKNDKFVIKEWTDNTSAVLAA